MIAETKIISPKLQALIHSLDANPKTRKKH